MYFNFCNELYNIQQFFGLQDGILIKRPLKTFEYLTTFLQCDLTYEKDGISLQVGSETMAMSGYEAET